MSSDFVNAFGMMQNAIADVGSVVSNSKSQSFTRDLQNAAHIQAMQRQWDAQDFQVKMRDEERLYNSYPAQMERLHEAGLNSALIYGSGSGSDFASGSTGSSPVSGASAPSAPPGFQLRGFDPSLANLSSDIALKASQTSLNDEKTRTESTIQALNITTDGLTRAKTATEKTQGAILTLQESLFLDTYQYKVDEVVSSLDLLQEQVDEARKRNATLSDMLDAELTKVRVDAFVKFISGVSEVTLNEAQKNLLYWNARLASNAYWSGLPDAMIGKQASNILTSDPGRLVDLADDSLSGKEASADVSSYMPYLMAALSFIPVGGAIGKGIRLLTGLKGAKLDRLEKMARIRQRIASANKMNRPDKVGSVTDFVNPTTGEVRKTIIKTDRYSRKY